MTKVFFFFTLGLFHLVASIQAQSTLSLEIKSSKPETAQIYYDFGSGFLEANSVKVKLKGNGNFERIEFAIPAENLKALRFDPLEKSGSVELRSVNLKSGDKQIPIPLDQVTPANQIAKTEIREGVLFVATTPGALDSQLALPITHDLPISSERSEVKAQPASSIRDIFSIKPMQVNDIVASQIVMADGNKTLDYFYFILFGICCFIIVSLFLNINLIERVLAWLSPAATWLILPVTILAGLLFSGGHSCLVGWVSSLSIVSILIMHLRSKLDTDHAWVITLGPWAIFSFASGILALANFLNVFAEFKQSVVILAQVLAPLVVLAGILLQTKHARMLGVLLATVTPIGLFCALPYFGKLGISANWTHHLFTALIFLAVFIIIFDQIFFGALNKMRQISPCRPWIWLAIPAILLPPIGLPTVSADFFHFGELILPFQQWWSFGQGPYEGFTAVQYGHAYMPGAINQFLFGGGASTFGIAGYYSTWILVTLSVAILLTFCPVPCVILLALVFTGNGMPHTFGLILAAISLFSIFRFKNNTFACLAFAPLVALFCLLWHPSTSLPLAALLMSALFLYLIAPHIWSRVYTKNHFYYGLVFLFVCCVLTYVSQTVLQLALENSITSTEAHGIEWWTMFNDVSKVDVPFEFSRVSFLLVTAIAPAYALFARDAKLWPWPRPILIIFGVMILSAGFFYGGNRIDPGHASRIGFISMVACAIWCFAISPLLRGYGNARLVFFIIWIVALSCYLIINKHIGNDWAIPDPIQRTLNRINKVSITPPIAQTLHAQGLGDGYFDPLITNQINLFIDAVEQLKISPDETWLDLTDNQTWYAYLNRRSPAPYSAAFPVVNIRQTKRMINALETSPPPVTLVSPSLSQNNVHIRLDDLPTSLRSYGLYKWALLRGGKLIEVNGFTFIDHRGGAKFSSEELYKLSQIFDLAPMGVINNLRSLPLVWGRSIDKLQEMGVISADKPLDYSLNQENMIPLESGWFTINFPEKEYLILNPDVKIAVDGGFLASGYDHYQTIGWREGRPLSQGNDQWPIFRINFNPNLSGSKAEFIELVLNFELYNECDSMQIDLRWIDDKGLQRLTNPVSLVVRNNKSVLIPLGAFVNWIKSDNINQLCIYLPEYKKIKRIQLSKIRGWEYGLKTNSSFK